MKIPRRQQGIMYHDRYAAERGARDAQLATAQRVAAKRAAAAARHAGFKVGDLVEVVARGYGGAGAGSVPGATYIDHIRGFVAAPDGTPAVILTKVSWVKLGDIAGKARRDSPDPFGARGARRSTAGNSARRAVRYNPEPVPPHNGRRAEVEVARSPIYVLWKTGGVVGQMKIWWIITDYTGRMYGMGYGGGAFSTKKAALAAWDALTGA